MENKKPVFNNKPVRTDAESSIAGTASCRIEVQGIEEVYEEYKKQGVLHSPDFHS